MKTTVYDCNIIEIGKHHNSKGNITVVENGITIPFNVKRVYYLYDVPGGTERGGHAHRSLHQVIIAMSGSFDVVLNDGLRSHRYHLNRSYYGLYICPMMWREIDNFSSGSVCMVLASDFYNEADYFRDFGDFRQTALAQR